MRRAALVAALATALVLLAWPDAHAENLGSDPFGDLTGGEGLRGRYPLSAYALDTHIDSSLNPASWGEEAVGFVTTILWTITRLLNALVFWLVDTAFNLDLLSADGPLTPIADAIRSINADVLGDPWMVAAIAAAGIWAIKKGIVERKHSEAASSLALSLILVLAVMFVVFRPIQTVGQAAAWSNDISEAVLVGVNTGGINNPERQKQRILDNMVRAVQIEPWAQLNFGGLRHCVDGTDRDKDGYPRPVDCDDPDRTVMRDHMKVVGGMGGYAPRFLNQPPGSEERKKEFEALRDGETPDPECRRGAGCENVEQFAGYRVDKSDSPAVDIQQSGAADGRLGMATIILLVSLAFAVLFGGLAILIMLVQVGALLVLAFSPVIMLAAVLPGPGHALAVAWGKKLLLLVLVFKPFFALVMAMLIVIHTSLAPGTSGMGWLPAYALVGAFYALVIWKHKWVGEKMQVARAKDSTKVERSVHEKTVQAGALIASPVAATWGVMKARQETAPTSQQQQQSSTPAQEGVEKPKQEPGATPATTPTGQAATAAAAGAVAGAVAARQSVPASKEGEEAQRANLPLADGQPASTATPSKPAVDVPIQGEPSAPITNGAQPPKPDDQYKFPGLNTPASVVSPQRRAERAEDLAPPPEYKGT